MIAVALLAHLSLLVTLSLVPIACATLVVTTLFRRLLTGAETLVLLEQFAFVLAASAAVLHLSGISWWPYLDVVVVGLSMFLVFGRIGCFVGGCCYGQIASIGVCYPRECGHEHRVRRLPLQLAEVIAALLTIARHDGSATAATLAEYGVARLALEPLRGDPRRRFLGATEGQWLSAIALAFALVMTEDRLPSASIMLFAGSACVLAVALWLTARWWLARDRGFADSERASIRALAPALRVAKLDASVQTWRAASLLFAASAIDDERPLAVGFFARPSTRSRRSGASARDVVRRAWHAARVGASRAWQRPVRG